MKNVLYKIIIALTCLLIADTIEAETSVSGKVAELIAESMDASTVDKAMEKLDLAGELLSQEAGKISELQSGFLYADIIQTKAKIYTVLWQRDLGKESTRNQARLLLQSSVEKYKMLGKQAEKDSKSIERRIRGDVDATKSGKWQQTSGYVSRANYSIAWSKYSLGIVAENEAERKEYLENAIENFSNFTESGYRQNAIIANCFRGKGLCLYELGRFYDVAKLLNYDTVTPFNTELVTFRQVSHLRMKAYQFLPSDIEVENSAKLYFDLLNQNKELSPIELEMAIMRRESLADNCVSDARSPASGPTAGS